MQAERAREQERKQKEAQDRKLKQDQQIIQEEQAKHIDLVIQAAEKVDKEPGGGRRGRRRADSIKDIHPDEDDDDGEVAHMAATQALRDAEIDEDIARMNQKSLNDRRIEKHSKKHKSKKDKKKKKHADRKGDDEDEDLD